MPFEQTCPGCGATFELEDAMLGKSLRCTECDKVFVGAKSSKRKRAAAPAKKSSGSGYLIAALGGLFFVLLLSCGAVIALVTTGVVPIGQPRQVANQDRQDGPIALDKDKEKERKHEKEPPPLLPLDAFGRGLIRTKLGENEVSYRVLLEKGKAYNFFVSSTEIEPRVAVSLDGRVVEGKRCDRSSFLSFAPEQTAAHTVAVSAQRAQAGGVELHFAPVQTSPPADIDAFKRRGGFNIKDAVRIQHPVSPLHAAGPSRSFRMQVKGGTEYEFNLRTQNFTPMLRLLKGDAPVGQWEVDPDTGAILALWKADSSGEIVILVGASAGLGEYTLDISVAPDRPVQGAGRMVDFQADAYQHIALFDKEAPRDEKGHPYVVYNLPVEPGWAYSIDHKHATSDCAVKLFDPAGKLIDANDRYGNIRHARILLDGKVNGQYRLHASVKEAGPFSYTFEVTRFKLPAPEIVNAPLKVERKVINGCLVAETELARGELLSSSCAWSRDGKLFVFDADGWLHRFRMPDFFEEQKLFLGKDGNNNIQVTADGIMATRVKRREIWLIDPFAMRIARRVPLLGGNPYLTSPQSRVLFTPVTASDEAGVKKSALTSHDLTGVAPLFAFVPDRMTGLLAVTPDGKYLLGRTDDNRIGRWRIVGRTLDFEQAGDLYGAVLSNVPLTVSADSRFLFRLVDPKQPAEDTKSAPPSGFGVLAYAISNPANPAFLIDTNTKSYAVATDPRTGRIYTHSESQGLMVADTTGKVLAEIPILKDSKTQNRVRRIFVHPDGGKLIAFAGPQAAGRVVYVELNREMIPVVKAPVKGFGFLRNFEPEPMKVGDLTVQKIATAIYWNTPIWSPDGKSIYVVQAQNTIYELDARDFSIRKFRNFFAPEMTWIRGGACWSSEGLLSLGCGDRQQGADMDLILLDPKTLQTIKRVRCPNSSHVASTPNLPVAFVGGKNPFTQSPNQPELLIVDLKTGNAVKPDVAFPLSPQTFHVSPDGKYFYGTDGRSIARFRIAGTKLIHEETSKPIAKEEKVLPRLEMSVDGKMVWLVGQAPATENGALGIHLLDALDFNQPARVLPARAYSANFDPLNKAFVIARHDKTLDFRFNERMGGDWKCDSPRQIIMHPQGGELFLVCNWTLYHVRWDAKKP